MPDFQEINSKKFNKTDEEKDIYIHKKKIQLITFAIFDWELTSICLLFFFSNMKT